MSLTWSHLDAAQAAAWAQLTHLVADHDGHEETYDTADILEQLELASFDAARQSWTVHAGDQLVATAEVHPRDDARFDGLGQVSISGLVHPDWRGQGLGTALLTRAEEAAHTLIAEKLPVTEYVLRASGWTQTDPARPLLVDFGYQLARHFHELTRPASAALPAAVALPDDLRLVEFTGEWDEATRLAHNDAFATHWGSGPINPARWAEFTGSRSLRPADSRLVVDGQQQVLAYALAGQWTEGELYVELVGTRADQQGRGLGRAVLTDLVLGASDSGRYQRISLDVDSQNPSDAGRLYRRLDFAPVRTTAVFQKRFLPGAIPA